MHIARLTGFEHKVLREKGTVFNEESWLSVYASGFNCYGIFDEGNNLVGGFNLFEYNKIGFKFIINPPFHPHCGLYLEDRNLSLVSENSFRKNVGKLLSEFLLTKGAALIDISFPEEFNDIQPFIWKGFNSGLKYTYLLNLEKTEDEIWSGFSSERRKSIRRGQDDKLEAKINDDFGVILALVEKTFARQGMRINLRLLERILSEFHNLGKVMTSTVYNPDGKAISASVFIYDSSGMYYLIGGYDEAVKHHGAGALSFWQAIRYCKEKQLKKFDFEGSMIPSVERFFREFGGVLTPQMKIKKYRYFFNLLYK